MRIAHTIGDFLIRSGQIGNIFGVSMSAWAKFSMDSAPLLHAAENDGEITGPSRVMVDALKKNNAAGVLSLTVTLKPKPNL